MNATRRIATLPFGDDYGIPLEMKAVRAAGSDNVLFICGQMDLDGNGLPRAEHDIGKQTRHAVELVYDAAERMGFRRCDVVKMGVHYVASEIADLPAYMALVRSCLVEADTLLTFTPLEGFPSGAGAHVEIDGLAIAGPQAQRAFCREPSTLAVRQDEFIFCTATLSVTDGAREATVAHEALRDSLAAVEAADTDLCAIWLHAPASLPVPALAAFIEAMAHCLPQPAPVLTIARYAAMAEGSLRLDAIAIRGPRKTGVNARESARGLGFSAATRAGRYIFVGGYLDDRPREDAGSSGDPLVDDSHRAMRRLCEGLAAVGRSAADIVFVNAYFIGHRDIARWRRNAQIRSSYYTTPGPAATGIEVSALLPEALQITVSCIAIGEDLP